MAEGFWILVCILIGVFIGNVLFSKRIYNSRSEIWGLMGGMLFGFLLITILVPRFLPGWAYLLLNSGQCVIIILATGITIAFRMLGEKK